MALRDKQQTERGGGTHRKGKNTKIEVGYLICETRLVISSPKMWEEKSMKT